MVNVGGYVVKFFQYSILNISSLFVLDGPQTVFMKAEHGIVESLNLC